MSRIICTFASDLYETVFFMGAHLACDKSDVFFFSLKKLMLKNVKMFGHVRKS